VCDDLQVVRAPAVVVGNSAGALAALQAAVNAPHLLRGLVLLDCTMRTMHERNQPAIMHPMISALQFVLHDTPLGQWAVDSVLRTPDMLKSILERYGGGLVYFMFQVAAFCWPVWLQRSVV
jgi:pimeloyl-ACP methyl ester carboxylesterase